MKRSKKIYLRREGCESCGTFTSEQVDNIWSKLKLSLLSATENTCGWTKKGILRKQTLWWNEKVSKDISEQKRLQKLWKAGDSKDKYLDATQKVRHATYTAKRNTEKEKFASINDNKENNFCITKQKHVENQDVIGQKCIGGDDGNLSLNDTPKKLARNQDYERLLNIEFL